MNRRRIRKIVAAATLHQIRPAAVGTSTLVVEYKRRLKGHGWWRQLIFNATRRWLRFCDTRLHLPTIIHHDRQGEFWVDYCGVFSDRNLAQAAIAEMERRHDPRLSQFGWQELDLNAVAPDASGRHYDNGFTGAGTQVFQRANQIVDCPFNGSRCNPDETVKRSQIDEVVELSANLNRRLKTSAR